jgi:hypothetical protein
MSEQLQYSAMRRRVFNTVVLANTDILSNAVEPQHYPCMLRVSVALSVATTFILRLTNSATTVSILLNSGANLAATGLYTFDIPLGNGDTANFQAGAGATVLTLKVIEVGAGT